MWSLETEFREEPNSTVTIRLLNEPPSYRTSSLDVVPNDTFRVCERQFHQASTRSQGQQKEHISDHYLRPYLDAVSMSSADDSRNTRTHLLSLISTSDESRRPEFTNLRWIFRAIKHIQSTSIRKGDYGQSHVVVKEMIFSVKKLSGRSRDLFSIWLKIKTLATLRSYGGQRLRMDNAACFT